MQCEPVAVEEDGWSEWIRPLQDFKFQCCDCGLIHELEFQIGYDNTLIFRARRYEEEQENDGKG